MRTSSGAHPLGSPSRGAGSAQPRLRGCHRFATAGCLRRPLLFRLAGKEGGEKGRWVTVLFILPLNSSGPQCFGLAFHSIVTSCVSDYAPPDTGVSDLQLVAVEQLPSIEGTVEIRMGVIFLRGRFYLQAPKHRLTRAHREKQLKMSCQALHNAPPNRT